MRSASKAAAQQTEGLQILLLVVALLSFATLLQQAPSHNLLAFNHLRPKWFQFVTSAFCNSTWQQTAQNMFFVYIFGRTVERAAGYIGLWAAFLLSAIGGNLLAFWLLPARAAMTAAGVSAAVAGLAFTNLVLIRTGGWHRQRLVELGALVPFLVMQLLGNQAHLAPALTMGRLRIGHAVSLVGGVLGAAAAYVLVAAAAYGRQRVLANGRPQPAAAEDEEDVSSVIKAVAKVFLRAFL